MILTIDSNLKKKCPAIGLGLVTAQVHANETPEALVEEMTLCEAAVLKIPDPRTILEAPAISSTRAGYKALGKDPARYRGSAEALLRRIISGKHFPKINSIVDCINLVSVESRLPVGLYDLAHVQGDMLFRVGGKGETYKGIGKFDLNLEGLPVFSDAQGPHGSPTSDSERTMVTASTEKVAAILVSFSGHQVVERWCQRLSSLLEKYAEGRDFYSQIVV